VSLDALATALVAGASGLRPSAPAAGVVLHVPQRMLFLMREDDAAARSHTAPRRTRMAALH
jgi:hypothetical protein